MGEPAKQSPAIPCPLGDTGCPIGDQLDRLQKQVEQLQKQVRTDHLTGLYNLRHLNVTLEQEMERTRRSRLPTTLIMLDVDHFKSFNDTYGHIVGDKVLTHLAKIIVYSIRKLDIPCRYGGEEFAILIPSSHLHTGVQIANRLRQSVESSDIIHNGKSLKITVSLGVETFLSNSEISAEEFVSLADKQLYAAKEAGRNCVKYVERERKKTYVSADEKSALFD